MSIALGAPQRSTLGAFIRSTLGARGFSAAGSVAGDLFIAGTFVNWEGNGAIDNMGAYDQFVSHAWVDTNNGFGAGSAALRFTMHGGELYACRGSTSPTAAAYKWDIGTGAWVAVGADVLCGNVLSIHSIAGELWACGGTMSVASGAAIQRVARYTGGVWSEVGTWDTTNEAAAIVNGLIEFPNVTGDVIAYGDYTVRKSAYEGQTGGCLMKIWDGSAWQASPSGRPCENTSPGRAFINHAVVWNGLLVLAAETTSGDGTDVEINAGSGFRGGPLCTWDGVDEANFEALSKDDEQPEDVTADAAIDRLCVHQDKLYAVGQFTASGETPETITSVGGVIEFTLTDDTWAEGGRVVTIGDLNGGMRTGAGAATGAADLCSYGDYLVVCSTTAVQAGTGPDTTVNGLYFWNGTAWEAPPGVTTGQDVSVVFNTGSDGQF